MTDDDETEDNSRGSPIEGAFGSGDGGPNFDDGPSTPSDGRVRLSKEESSVLDEIERLKEEQPEPYPHDTLGDVAYIPVGDSMLPYLEKRARDDRGYDVGGRALGWWKDEGLMAPHPYMLLNPTTLANRNYHYNAGVARNFIRAKKGDVFILADSGGFQLVNSGMQVTDDVNKHDWDKHIHPERVVEWQVANSDAGTVLDVPVYNRLDTDDNDRAGEHQGLLTDDYSEWYSDVFESRKLMTKKHSIQADDRLNEIDYDDFSLVAVLHGMPRQDGKGDLFHSFREWFEALDGIRDWDGWSLSSPYEGKVGAVALLLGFSAQYIDDVDFVHVLGQGNVWARIISKLYAQETDTFVTMDGTGFKTGSMFSSMYMPSTYMKSLRLTDRDGPQPDSRYEKLEAKRMPCGCSVCRHVEDEIGGEELFGRPGTERMVLMDMHNLNHLLRRFYMIDSFVEARGRDLLDEVTISQGAENAIGATVDPQSEFWRMMLNWYSESKVVEIYYCMDFLLKCIDGDVDEAMSMYHFNTPFFDFIANKSKGDGRGPSIWRESGGSVFDW
jgi:hypothetical protein